MDASQSVSDASRTPGEPPADRTGRGDDETLRQSDAEREASRDLSLRSTEAPANVPGYEILTTLGEGSFGAVWLARELKTGKRVAIKFYSHRRGLDWSLLTREVEKLAVLYTSRNIVGLLDVGWNHDPPYFVMEFLDHGSLADRLQSGRLPVETAVRMSKAIGRALVHAHGSGILHCDLKPANVLLDAEDEPRLGDFGQSRLTTEQSPALGTLFYMSPEQADLNAVPDAQWDVYALGALLYQMLTGSPPHRTAAIEQRIMSGGTLEDRLRAYRAAIRGAPRPGGHRAVKGVDKRLATIVEGCLEPDPAKRWKNAQVVLDLLEQRDKSRARRPLMVLGVLGPLLLLSAIFWIARTHVPRAVEAAEKNLVDRALAGDAVSALILADGIQRDLASRQAQLEGVSQREEVWDVIAGSHGVSAEELQALNATVEAATEEELAALIRNPEADPTLRAFAEFAKRWRDNAVRMVKDRRTNDQSWFIQDGAGRQVFRMPARTESGGPMLTIGASYHWRSYFTGKQFDLPENTPVDQIMIRDQPGMSNVFRSQATNQYMVAIAVPIRSADGETVLGVLARTIHISDLLKQWERAIRDPAALPGTHDRFLALANFERTTDGFETTLLDHPWMSSENLTRVAPSDEKLDALTSELSLSSETTQRLAGLMTGKVRDHREPRYQDPISRRDQSYAGNWLAAFAAVRGTSWLAIVQERRAVATQPVQEVRQVFSQAGVVAVIVVGVLLGVLWYFLQRASAR